MSVPLQRIVDFGESELKVACVSSSNEEAGEAVDEAVVGRTGQDARSRSGSEGIGGGRRATGSRRGSRAGSGRVMARLTSVGRPRLGPRLAAL